MHVLGNRAALGGYAGEHGLQVRGQELVELDFKHFLDVVEDRVSGQVRIE